MYDIEVTTKGKSVKWFVPDGLQVRVSELDSKKATLVGKKGKYTIFAWTCLKTGPTDAAKCIVTVGVPPTPVPPGPIPVPPEPPAPITKDGYRDLIVYESSDLQKRPKEQLALLNSTALRQKLNTILIK